MLPLEAVIRHSQTLTQRLEALHVHLLESFPSVDRIACILYDPGEDLLKTFLSSTRGDDTLTDYRFKLADSRSLSEMARTGSTRVLEDISNSFLPDTPHSAWLLSQGFRSSFTVPIKNDDLLYGFIFFDSREVGAFTIELQRNLLLNCSFIGMLISNEIVAAETLLGSTRIAIGLVGVRDFETGAHLKRVAQYSELIARHVAPAYNLDDEFIEMVHLFAPLHDIGKVGIPDKILAKAGPLSDEERLVMQTHVEKGVKIVEETMAKTGSHEMPDSHILRNIVYAHHEFLDGSGYPQQLKGDEIPLEARIVAVADVFDALTSFRPYKEHWSNEAAFRQLLLMVEQGKLDQLMVMALVENSAGVREIQRTYGEGILEAEV